MTTPAPTASLAASPKTASKPAVATRYCRECGEPFAPKSPKARFCSTACKNAEHNREALIGRRIAEAAISWRRHRRAADADKRTHTMADVTHLADRALARENEHKRLRAERVAAFKAGRPAPAWKAPEFWTPRDYPGIVVGRI